MQKQVILVAGMHRSGTSLVNQEIEQEIGEFAKRLLAQEFQVFSIKDPRICRIIPWWRSAFESCGARVSAIIPYRHPLEVAASIGNRDGFSTKYCLSLWLRNVLDAEFATRQLDRVFCSYEGILSDWPSIFCEITEKLQLSSLRPFSEVKNQIDDFASGSLKHWSFSDSELEHFVGSDGLATLPLNICGNSNRKTTQAFKTSLMSFGKYLKRHFQFTMN